MRGVLRVIFIVICGEIGVCGESGEWNEIGVGVDGSWRGIGGVEGVEMGR